MLPQLAEFIKKYKSYFFIILLAVLFLRVMIPQLDDLKESLAALKTADLRWILAGIFVYFAGITTFAFQIDALAFKPLVYLLTYKVEMAGQFVSKLLPSFVGTISLNMYYLVKKAHSGTQAATVMTANALTSSVAYIILIILALTQSDISFDNATGSIDVSTNLILFLIILAVGITYYLYKSVELRSKAKGIWADVRSNIKAYKKKPLALLISTVCNGLGSAANIFAIYASGRAIGVDVSFAEALLAYTFGNIAMSLVPTPGGIGAAEAGIYSGLVFAGINGADAITVTLLYRLISYWLPIIPGYVFFLGLRKNVLADFSFKKRYST